MKSNPSKKQSSRTNLKIIIAIIMLFTVGLLALTHDIILTNYFAYRICKAGTQPKTFTKKTVPFPESIYWEDNIYPGFDEKDRLLMIRNYLDGVHLKTMALNAPDGSIYRFTATAADWQESKDIKSRKREGNYFDTLDAEARVIAGRGKLYTPETLPQLNYSVVFNPVALTSFQQPYLYSDEVIIRDINAGEVIGYNRRLMRRWYMLEFEPVGGCMSMTELYSIAIYGESLLYNLDDQIFFRKEKNTIIRNFKCKRAFRSKL